MKLMAVAMKRKGKPKVAIREQQESRPILESCATAAPQAHASASPPIVLPTILHVSVQC